MDRRDRNTLKSYFRKGNAPTELQFAELIDSVPNIVEDGQPVLTEEGWAFCSHRQGKMRITIHEAVDKPAIWTLALTPDKGFAIANAAGETLLELKQDKIITLHATVKKDGGGEEEPGHDPEGYRVIEADKEWVNLVEIPNCKESSRVYTIMAIYRDKNLDVYKLTYATAICLNTVEQWVESPCKQWWGWSGRVRLRWQATGNKAVLQIRSTRNSCSGRIYCRVTETFRR